MGGKASKMRDLQVLVIQVIYKLIIPSKAITKPLVISIYQ